MAFGVCFDFVFQTYSKGVCSLCIGWVSGFGPGPGSFGSQSSHAMFHCVGALCVLCACGFGAVTVLMYSSRVIWAGLTGHLLSVAHAVICGQVSLYLLCQVCGSCCLPWHTVCQFSMKFCPLGELLS